MTQLELLISRIWNIAELSSGFKIRRIFFEAERSGGANLEKISETERSGGAVLAKIVGAVERKFNKILIFCNHVFLSYCQLEEISRIFFLESAGTLFLKFN